MKRVTTSKKLQSPCAKDEIIDLIFHVGTIACALPPANPAKTGPQDLTAAQLTRVRCIKIKRSENGLNK